MSTFLQGCDPVVDVRAGSPVVPESAVIRENGVGDDGRVSSTSRLTWLTTTSGRPVLARVDEPAGGQARGAVVVVPSVGRETTVPFRRLRALAVRAADAGFVAVSLFLGGDGESPDVPADLDLVSVWGEEVEAAVAAAGAAVPDRPVSVVGWRLGGALAFAHVQAVAAAEEGVVVTPVTGSVVLWEPVSGASFLRQHQNLRKFASPVEVVDEGVELCGYHFSEGHAASLKGLKAPRRAGEGDVFEIVREPDPKAVLQLTLGSPHFVQTRVEDADALVGRLASGVEGPFMPVPQVRDARWEDASGRVVEESIVLVGPDLLPGVLTSSPEAGVHGAVLYTAIGSELRAGPGNAWTAAARALAPHGVLGLRMDRRELGETTDVRYPGEPFPYTETSVEDVLHGAAWLRQRGGVDVFGVGACSGAWSVLRAAASEGAFNGVVAVNPVHWDPDSSNYDEAFYAKTYRSEGAFSQVLSAAGDGAEEEDDAQSSDTASSRGGMRMWFHEFLHDMAIRFPRLRGLLRGDRRTDRVAALLTPVDRRTVTVLALGLSEAAVFRAKGGPMFMRTPRLDGRFRLQVDERIDHSLFAQTSRQVVFDAVQSLLVERDVLRRPVEDTAL
ncbi:hypothetical protein [Dermatophilus congolensis]|uniref:hypothetical protein n=1 Tax=Dermatophilus congolensis TaxID=1863 RepID=UPI001AAE5400|nr:hypothetical protein [Dermatophilus congolensis]MBO3129870.1 hypothetical protein [Dermatophilus congolensis]MBO3131502.1 hypothetical protein [Dermatophilus congolensis]MBO3136579.1 hypothetical protein [Dermatophilus congolensis]MBO3141059.1 hypothetical protein [Dermatophilus congolensis]MBO3144903.1 hypothetical protein [Dermatophilus congolensis]